MTASPASHRAEPAFDSKWPEIWRFAAAVWILVLVVVPDPRPLGAPEWTVGMVRGLLGADAPSARLIATLVLRIGGIGLLGALVMLGFGTPRRSWRTAGALIAAPVLSIGVMWIHYGYFPIFIQLQIGALSAALGALAGMALRRNRLAAFGFVAVTIGVFAWGTATGIDDELDRAARVMGEHVLAEADDVPDGDAGFAALLEIAFAFAEQHSREDPLLPNRAAILALGVILGDDRVAAVAKRQIDESRDDVKALRDRITVHGRNDWVRHFWVSAALTLLSDNERSISVGITKELMDATPGGTGFSFPDLAADAAGNRFTLAATRDEAAARAMQARIRAGVQVADFVPDVTDLPEGLSRDVFQSTYGGLGGAKTGEIVDEILRRLDACQGLR